MGIYQQRPKNSLQHRAASTIPSVAKGAKIVGLALLLLGLSCFWLLAFRFVSLPFLIVSWILFIKSRGSGFRSVVVTCVMSLTLCFSPIDILPIPKGGTPRLVPLVMGLPRRETVERANRGEVILGGCIVTGFEPKYYLVW
jgi:hypothetical protein